MVRNLVNFSLKVSLDGVPVGASGTRLIVYLDIVNYYRLLFHSQQQMEVLLVEKILEERV